MNNQNKNKAYRLKNGRRPLSFTIQTAHKHNMPLLWFDEKQKVNRELRYARNQKSPFVDEQDGHAIVEPVTFEDGMLQVPYTNPVLQEFLDLHPLRDKVFEEVDKEKDAEAEFQREEIMAEAIMSIKKMDVQRLAILYRGFLGKSPETVTASEMRWDLTALAKRDPEAFLETAEDPEMEFRSNVVSFFENNLLGFRKGKSEVYFNLKNNKQRMLIVPKGADAYDLVANWLKSDDGIEMLKMLEKENKVD